MGPDDKFILIYSDGKNATGQNQFALENCGFVMPELAGIAKSIIKSTEMHINKVSKGVH